MSKKKTKGYLKKYKIVKADYGQGGNANVHICSHIDEGYQVALKELLVKKSDEKKTRFCDEIQIMLQYGSVIDGIIPILDYSKEEFWYTMPIATSAMEHIKNNNLDIVQIIDGIIQLTDTLILLHNKGISHRDIKPSNIYYYKDRYCLGDFGLVDHPDNSHTHTKSDRGLGAIFTIAPEMKRNPKGADGTKADVYSLSKTLWMFLTLDEKGFDGPYNFLDESYSLRFNSKYEKIHLVELEKLLLSSTMNAPEDRPTIEAFKMQLTEWKQIYQNEEASQLSDWNFLHEYLFKGTTPDSTSWSKTDDIVKVLNIIGSIPAYNHLFFSDGGGLDFNKTEKAGEKGCIYIYAQGFWNVVKPKRLYFNGFDDFTWNYFLLELEELSPIFEGNDASYEYLVEDYPGHYVYVDYPQYGVYDYDKGDKLPEGAKEVYRYLKGKFLIVLKYGPYNSIQTTYDGRHGDCNSDEFRKYIDEIINIIEKGKERGYTQEEVLEIPDIRKNPFRKNDKLDNLSLLDITKPSPNKFIEENFQSWSFSDIIDISTPQQSNNIIFYFKFEGIVSFLLKSSSFFLSNDGKIKNIVHTSYNEMYTCSDRNDAIKVQRIVNDKIREICETNGFDDAGYENYFSIKLVRNGIPNHLFTREEIKLLLKEADDRQTNQLVIDENGYAKLVNDPQVGKLYPVRHESWSAGNLYVGKYSSLSHLEETYISLLEGWLCYLETGNIFFQDSIESEYDEDELIRRIKTHYLCAEANTIII